MATKQEPQLRCPVPNGKLMIIGGAEKKQEPAQNKAAQKLDIHEAFIRLIGKDRPSIGIVTTAGTADTDATFETYKTTFESLCACSVFHIHHDKMSQIDDEASEKQLASTDALFFAGGDQLKLSSIYGGSMFLYHAKNSYIYKGLVIGGTSAGAMALSTPMIYAGSGDHEIIAGEVKITTGFEFLKDVCIDTHFVHRGRFVRMAQVIATNPACIGIGIEEDTAIVIKNGIEAEVYGHGVVIVIDGRSHTENNITEFNASKALNIRGLRVDILAAGQQFELQQLNPPHY